MAKIKFATVAALAALFAAPSASAATCTYTDGVWDVTPSAADDIVIASGDLTWASPLPTNLHSWTQLSGYTGTITFSTGLDAVEIAGDVSLAGGKWTHSSNPSLTSSSEAWLDGRGTMQLIVNVGGDFTVSAGASISADNAGFRVRQGPGFGQQGRSASHGGCGRGASSNCYGSVVSPVTIGSGGRDVAGGGAVRLSVAGAFTLDGTVSADSVTASGDYQGAGGSVFITARAISGGGSISARGAAPRSENAGGGGRIALKLTGPGENFSAFTGQITAFNGKTGTGTGTIYFETAADLPGRGRLLLAAAGAASGVTELHDTAGYEFSEVCVTNGAALGVYPGVTVKAGKLLGHNATLSVIRLCGGAFRIPAGSAYSNVNVTVFNAGSTLACGDTGAALTLGGGATVTMRQYELALDSLTMLAGSTVTHALNGATDMDYGVRLRVAGDLRVDSGASVNGDAKGFYGAGPGWIAGCGGSHGGVAKGAPATAVYGSVKFPVTLGSDTKVSSRYGGGRVRLSVGGTLTVNGTVSSDGGYYNGGAYSPAGGSIWIDAASLAGAGKIIARGGCSNSSTSSGSGGRVAVYLTRDNETFDAFCAAGGEIGAPGGGLGNNASLRRYKPTGPCGTTYLSYTVGGVTNAALFVRNRDSDYREGGATIGPDVTDADVDNVIFETNGVLRVAQNGVLSVRGDWIRSAAGRDAFIAETGDADNAGGAVSFIDADVVSTVTGTNEFAILQCTAPSKTIKFAAAGSLTRIIAGGSLIIAGDDSAAVNLRSTADGAAWLLDVVSGAGIDISRADVKDSDALTPGGILVPALNSVDSGNNLNWSFSSVVVGEEITWNGSADDSWANADNWDLSRTPVDTDVVIIPGDAGNQPVLAGAVALNSLDIRSGASLNLAGYCLTVTNLMSVAGSLVCTAAERIEASGPSIALTGAFTAAGSTFVLTGGLAQSFNPAGNAFHIVRIEKSGGSLTLADGFSAYQFHISAVEPVLVAFAAGRTVTATDFYANGDAGGAAALTLASAASGSQWMIDVSRQARVRGAVVGDSAATRLTLHDYAPATDSGGNSNWTFGGTFHRWIGGASGNFTNAACWSAGTVPSASSLVYFGSDAAVTLSAPWTVREIQIEGGSVSVGRTTNTLAVAESLSVENGATLSLTAPCTVGHTVIVRSGGTLTHDVVASLPGPVTNRLFLAVARDMTVEAGGAVNVDGKGFNRACQGGLGYVGGSSSAPGGPSHAAIGSAGVAAYGSVFEPIHPGSCSRSGDVGNEAGGAVRLAVGGTLTLDGSVTANSKNGNWYVGTGGSVWITAGRLVGGGSISADAGTQLVDSNSAVSGGRIAVKLTEGDFSGWSGEIRAWGTTGKGDRPSGSAGTVYLQSGDEADGFGTLYVTGRRETHSFGSMVMTPFPVAGWNAAADFANVKFVIGGRAQAAFKENMKIRDVMMEASGAGLPRALMFDHVVKVESLEHRGGKGWAAAYDTLVAPGDLGVGRFYWQGPGLMLFVR